MRLLEGLPRRRRRRGQGCSAPVRVDQAPVPGDRVLPLSIASHGEQGEADDLRIRAVVREDDPGPRRGGVGPLSVVREPGVGEPCDCCPVVPNPEDVVAYVDEVSRDQQVTAIRGPARRACLQTGRCYGMRMCAVEPHHPDLDLDATETEASERDPTTTR